MKRITLVAGLLGLGLAVWMFAQYGVHSILSLIAACGWGVLVVIAFHGIQVCLSAQAWRIISSGDPGSPHPPAQDVFSADTRSRSYGAARAGGHSRLPLGDYVLLRCVREGINNLLPVAQVGGEVVSSRLLARRGLGLRQAAAGTICDLTIELISQIVFTLAGVGLLLFLVKRSTATDRLMESAVVLLAIGVTMFASQWLGAVAIMEKLLLRIAAHLGWSGAAGIRGIHAAVLSLYKTRHNALTGLAIQLLAWALGSVEVYLILHFMGHDRSIAVSFVIEGVGEAAKSAGFAVPGALGVSEGGYVVVGSLFGIAPEAAMALSLVKRLRELAWGLPSLALWQWLEHAWVTHNPGQERSSCP
ncbi:MAG: flippase-like domain-containing protein [Acetobacter sp.]